MPAADTTSGPPPSKPESRFKTKAEIKAWMTAKGVWSVFVHHRDRLKRDGIDHTEAWHTAAEEIASHIDGGGDFPATKARQKTSFADPNQDALATEMQREDVLELIEAGRGKTSTLDKRYEWVFENLGVPYDHILKDGVPSSGAAALLVWARFAGNNMTDFYVKMHSKLVPSRQVLEAKARYEDDGSSARSLAERLIAVGNLGGEVPALPAGAEGEDGEPALANELAGLVGGERGAEA